MGLEFWHFQIVFGTKAKMFRILAPNFCKISSLSKNTRKGGTSAPLAYIQL